MFGIIGDILIVVVIALVSWFFESNRYLKKIAIEDKHKEKVEKLIERGIDLAMAQAEQLADKGGRMASALSFMDKWLKMFNININQNMLREMIEAKLYERNHK